MNATPGFWRPVGVALLTAALLAFGAGPVAERAEAGSPCTSYGEVRAEQLRTGQARAAVRCFLNRERDRRGLRSLRTDSRLQRASQAHTETMMRKGCFAHECPGERSLEGRLSAVDYLLAGLLRWAFGENIAYGTGHYGTPKSIVQGWMDSPGHRANILNPAFRDVGVGFLRGTPGRPEADGGLYTTDFGLRLR